MTGAAKHNPILECLRGLAALAVCLLHLTIVGFGPIPMHWAFVGNLGVDLFFVLSGFLIARCVLVPDRFRLGEYLTHRSRRILPAYFACLVIVLLLVDARQMFNPDFGKNLLLHVTLLHGWSQPFYQSINGPFWTLSHEWCFYLFMALIAPLLRGRAFWIVVAAMAAGSLTFRSLLQAGVIAPPLGFQHPLCFLDRFACGMAAARCALGAAADAKLLRWGPASALLLAGGLLLAWAVWRYLATAAQIPAAKLQELEGTHQFFRLVQKSRTLSVFMPLAFSAGMGTLLVVFWLKPRPLAALLRRTPLPWMGKVSYATYLWHLPLMHGLSRAFKTHPDSWLANPWLALGGVLALVYLFSWIFYEGFERPYLKRRPS